MSEFSAYAVSGAWALLTMAGVFAWLEWKHGDAGARWFAIAYAIAGGIFLFDARLRPLGDISNRTTGWIATLAFASFAMGLFDSLGMATRQRLRWWSVALAGPLALVVAQSLMPVPRVVALCAMAVTMGVLAVPPWLAGRREPGVGHGVVAAALLSYPVAVGSAIWRAAGTDAFRYVVILPLSATGLTLIVISLSRARTRLQRELQRRQEAEAALRTLNQTLEQRVDERTEELHGVIAGLESFNRMVSHDLRGPLAGLSGLSPLVQQYYDEGKSEQARELLSLIATQTERLSDLVSDLLTLCRLSEGQLQRRRAPLDESLREALETLALTVGEAGVAHVQAQPLPTANVDPSLIRQVFVNLIGNALKFSRHAAPPRVEVSATQHDGEIVLSVKDNGAGFDMARARDLFEPFKRLHAGYEGSGIGLTIVRRIVERHGGRAWAEGRPGEGAAFYVSLPA